MDPEKGGGAHWTSCAGSLFFCLFSAAPRFSCPGRRWISRRAPLRAPFFAPSLLPPNVFSALFPCGDGSGVLPAPRPICFVMFPRPPHGRGGAPPVRLSARTGGGDFSLGDQWVRFLSLSAGGGSAGGATTAPSDADPHGWNMCSKGRKRVQWNVCFQHSRLIPGGSPEPSVRAREAPPSGRCRPGRRTPATDARRFFPAGRPGTRRLPFTRPWTPGRRRSRRAS